MRWKKGGKSARPRYEVEAQRGAGWLAGWLLLTLKVAFVRPFLSTLWVSCIERTTVKCLFPPFAWTRRRTCPFTSGASRRRGSWSQPRPRSTEGGSSPVVANLRHSTTVCREDATDQGNRRREAAVREADEQEGQDRQRVDLREPGGVRKQGRERQEMRGLKQEGPHEAKDFSEA